MQIDLLVVEDASFGAATQYFTGSKEHNIEVRAMAQKLGMKVNEYGIFKDDTRVGGEHEEDIYNILGIPMPKPEDR
jgi:DNA polymerase (family 10)